MKLFARPAIARLLAPALLALSALSTACTEGHDAASPLLKDRARLPLRAAYAVTPFTSAPVNRIRITVRVDPAGPQFGPFIFNVDPNQAEWALPVELQITAAVNVIVQAELINVNNSVEAVLYSGRIGPIKVTPGDQQQSAPPIALYPGDLSNLDITSIQVTAPTVVLEGATFQLNPTVQGGGSSPTVVWKSLTPTLATVDANGLVQALLPGIARIEAQAGPKSTVAELRIDRRMDKVVITPASITLSAAGLPAEFSAEVVDPRGQAFPNVALVWSVADPAIAQNTGPGKYLAKGGGRTTVIASVQGIPQVRGSAEIIVDQRAAQLVITPTSARIESLNGTFTFTGVARDANGAVLTNPGFKWSSSVPAVATIDQSGVATAKSPGKTVITLETGNLSVKADLEVLQKVVSVRVTPAQHQFTAVADTQQFTVEARDANNQLVNRSPVWRSTNTTVVQVDSTGKALAVGNGVGSVVAQIDNVTGSAAITVHQVLVRLALNATSITLQKPGDKFVLQVFGVDANNNAIKGLSATMVSSNPLVATVGEAGEIVAVNKGQATIQVSLGGLIESVPVTVLQGNAAPPPPPPPSASISIVPLAASNAPVNCIPFGTNTAYAFSGFIYRNVPAFQLNAGDHIAFDLGALTADDVRRNIYFGVANKNPGAPVFNGSGIVSQGIAALGWTKVVSDNATPLNPRGDAVQGSYELEYTATAAFTFPGGGLIVGFGDGNQPGAYRAGGCEQVLVATTAADPQGQFYARFYFKPDQTLATLDNSLSGNGVALGGIKIWAAGAVKPAFVSSTSGPRLEIPNDAKTAGSVRFKIEDELE